MAVTANHATFGFPAFKLKFLNSALTTSNILNYI